MMILKHAVFIFCRWCRRELPKYTEYLARWEGIIKENENCFRQEGKYNIRKFVRERELFASFRK